MGKTTLRDVFKIIDKWQKENNVMFFGDFIEFDDNGNIEDKSAMIAYGNKKVLGIGLNEFTKLFNRDKNKFINW